MTSKEPDQAETAQPKRPNRDTEEWIDQTMAEGDIANGEGDPEGPRPGDPDR
jgi:hypothetical protein